jgi:hypothetical protein
MTRVSVLNDCLNNIVNAERRGKRQVLIRPASKVVVKVLSVMQKHGELNLCVFCFLTRFLLPCSFFVTIVIITSFAITYIMNPYIDPGYNCLISTTLGSTSKTLPRSSFKFPAHQPFPSYIVCRGGWTGSVLYITSTHPCSRSPLIQPRSRPSLLGFSCRFIRREPRKMGRRIC